MLAYLMVWEGTHRTLIFGAIALAIWGTAWWIYLRTDIRNYFKHRRPHRWAVDMETKQVTAGRKPVV